VKSGDDKFEVVMATKKSSRKTKDDRDEERGVSRQTFVKTLRRIADALEAGEVAVIQVRGERIRIPKGALLSVEHEREGAAEELELQMKWGAEGED
jgi:amphi-Trp domain-containing protein